IRRLSMSVVSHVFGSAPSSAMMAVITLVRLAGGRDLWAFLANSTAPDASPSAMAAPALMPGGPASVVRTGGPPDTGTPARPTDCVERAAVPQIVTSGVPAGIWPPGKFARKSLFTKSGALVMNPTRPPPVRLAQIEAR